MSDEVKTEKCGAVARFTYFGQVVVCCKPAGHLGNHLFVPPTGTTLSWREGRTIKGDVGPQIESDLREAFGHVEKAPEEEET